MASDPAQRYGEVFAERTPLYRRCADVTIDATHRTADEVCAAILRALQFKA
jgi:shikimate kinase